MYAVEESHLQDDIILDVVQNDQIVLAPEPLQQTLCCMLKGRQRKQVAPELERLVADLCLGLHIFLKAFSSLTHAWESFAARAALAAALAASTTAFAVAVFGL